VRQFAHRTDIINGKAIAYDGENRPLSVTSANGAI
jgi:hypothetical protein